MSRSKMEAELKCQKCLDWFKSPLLMPCTHSICKLCAESVVSTPDETIRYQQKAISDMLTISSDHDSLVDDRLSVFSEADSGVVLGAMSNKTSSSITGSSIPNNSAPVCINATNRSPHYAILCKICYRVNLLDERGVECLLSNRAMENVVTRFLSKTSSSTDSPSKLSLGSCQSTTSSTSAPANTGSGVSQLLCNLCEEEENAQPATIVCQQCQIFYCRDCCDRCHPNRGPLARHNLYEQGASDNQFSVVVQQINRSNGGVGGAGVFTRCSLHTSQQLSIYCVSCSEVLCSLCMQETHLQHDLHQLNSICKAQKTELSQLLQSLSEKAKTGTYFIQNLKSMSEKMSRNYPKKEEDLISSMDNLIKCLEQKKIELLGQLRSEKDRRTVKFKEHIHQSTAALGKANGLLQFCIEMLKESDPTAFLLVSHSLIAKVTAAEQAFLQEVELKPRTTPDFDMKLSNLEIIRSAISSLRLSEHQNSPYSASLGAVSIDTEAPHAPIIWREQCRIENNIFTVLWQPYPGPPVEFYTLEIDDGAGGSFRKVYRGCESICTVEGLHFRAIYRIRVKAHNRHGDSNYSDVVCLQTGTKTWFCFDPKSTPRTDISYANDNNTISTDSIEDRVILGSTSLTRGVHYWEFSIDKLEPGGQPSFGIAKSDCNRDIMLGKDGQSWAMYLDNKRSWFIHNNDHFERTDGGIRAGSVIGVRLDCDKGNLSYYIDDEPHGPIAFSKLKGTLYPAVSINRFVQISLLIGRDPPSESSEEESGEDYDTNTQLRCGSAK